MSVALRGVTFRYRPDLPPVLHEFDLDIADGESVAIMAPSGAGKTTLLAIAGLLLAPQLGSVAIDGVARSVADAPPLLGNTIAFVLQSVNLLSRRTVIDNITLPAVLNGGGRDDAERRAAELAKQLDIADLLQRPARAVSGGQAQRVAIARALLPRPSLLIADEPTANLDVTTAAHVASMMLKTEREDTALLLATHDPAVAALAERTIRLGGP